MRTADEQARLVAEALRWLGTPFADRGATLGAGVNCHRLPAEVLAAAGWVPPLDVPEGPVGWATAHGRSLMEEWLDDGPGRQVFASVDPADRQVGDVLGFRLGRCVHHLGLSMPDQAVLHCISPHGVVLAHQLPPAWARRLVRAWRPRENLC